MQTGERPELKKTLARQMLTRVKDWLVDISAWIFLIHER